MRSAVSAVLGLVALIAFTTAPAKAQTAALDAFGVACSANPHFFDFAVTGLESDPESLSRLCGCLATEFTPLADADLAILTKDLDGSSTEADKTAYGDYAGLELKARAALDKCLVGEGYGDTADMSGFEKACTGSAIMLTIVGDAEGAEERRTTICSCLVAELAPKITTADADILGTDLAGTSTEESHAAYEGYAAAEQKAGDAFDGCLAQIEGSPPPET